MLRKWPKSKLYGILVGNFSLLTRHLEVPEGLRDFIHISDVCQVLSVFTLDKWTSGSYNVDVGTGTSISISRVVQLCADALQRKGLQPFDWHFADACDNRAPSAMKALNTAEWSPHHSSFLPIAEGIDSYVEWFVDSGSNYEIFFFYKAL